MILNKHRQIVAVNKSLLDALQIQDADQLLGKRPGEASADRGVITTVSCGTCCPSWVRCPVGRNWRACSITATLK